MAYALAESRRFHALVRSSSILERSAHRRAAPYLGGESLDEALITVDRLRAEGFEVGVDCFGEGRTDRFAVAAATDQYLRLNEALGHRAAGVNVWVDLTNVGLDVSDELCRHQLARIAASLPAGSRLQVRAHDSSRIDRILGLTIELAENGVPVTPTLQANLRRSPDYADRLIAGVPVLLVKGAHLERPEVALPWGEETDVAYLRLADQLHAGGVKLSIATHDPVVREALLTALPDVGIEMLLGVRPGDAHHFLRRGRPVRLYVPFGDDWLRYWLRRVGESRGRVSSLRRAR